ncbi:hypothetical protein J5Y09_06775 [Roseomonas sp. PWR1]|uniref:Uncharacterized protein n=1 Tax=Roseomonas nitratireducens TaxID=2820810 RepID=A0ABS4AQG4_9PROT|nr:hypothetical protein [Neoroseomonas nitratireducens]MBP0463607.1 hypothetical protein [Neoroseomonas nitratireducens]
MHEPDFSADLAALRRDQAALDAMPGVEYLHGRWVVVRNGILRGLFDCFPDASRFATSIGPGPALVQQVGEPPIVLDLRR